MTCSSTTISALAPISIAARARPDIPAPTITIRGRLGWLEWALVSMGSVRGGLELPDQGRDDLEQIADNAKRGNLEDRRLWIAVDRDDAIGSGHPDKVLGRSGDANRQVQLRTYGMTGGSNLVAVRTPSRADRGARCADGRMKHSGEFLDQREVLGFAEATPAGDDALGLCQALCASRMSGLLDQGRPQIAFLDRYSCLLYTSDA